MTLILQAELPAEMRGEKALPGVAPCEADDWLRVDDAYAAQMAYRASLLAEKRDKVLWMDPSSQPVAQEMLEETLKVLPPKGFEVAQEKVRRPDGQSVPVDWDDPMGTLGLMVQQDICLLEKRGDEHVLAAAVLCFPANWRLAQKASRPLTTIHSPVPEYDGGVARRVQRLFDGVQVGKPLYRFNNLPYGDADLHQPKRKDAKAPMLYLRAERQCILRLPRTRAVAFVIHTYVVRRDPESG